VIAAEIWPDGPAARAGVAQGDLIETVNGQPVNDAPTLTYNIGAMAPGSSVSLALRKASGAERTVTARVEAPPDTPAKDLHVLEGRNPLNGATVVNLSPAAAVDLGLDPFAGTGVVVTAVGGGYAANLGLQPGDFVREINGRKVGTVAELLTVLNAPADTWTIAIERGGHLITARVQL
jgi:S1-C subfamily serine protease